MKIKTFLIDLDGVVLQRADYFSNRVKTLYPNANHNAIVDFFVGGTYTKVAKGETDLVEAISEVISSWNVEVSTEQLIKTWYEGENDVDTSVLNRIKEIRDSGVRCVIVTDHSKYRKDDVWNNLHMDKHFDDIIASADVGATKEELDFFRRVLNILNIENTEMVAFIDDDPKNVTVAKSLGIKGVVFEELRSFDKVFDQSLFELKETCTFSFAILTLCRNSIFHTLQ